ncbi:phosphoserine aminotransferase, partial [Curtobacterium oceanosedimentum]
QCVATLDLDDTSDAGAVAATLRANGIVYTEPYLKLGRNRLRVAPFSALDPYDVAKLVRSLAFVVGALRG